MAETGEQQGLPPTIDPLLQATIFNKDKDNRKAEFAQVWQERWNTGYHSKRGYFGTEASESPFSQYSSRGWKIHIAFTKGEERDVAEDLFLNGLYFKVESEMGTYFNGTRESGATVYIGGYKNMMQIAGVMEQNLGTSLVDGAVAHAGNQTIKIGSGTDIEIRPRTMARFDVAKTPFGWLEGNGKYAEAGIPTWMGLGGIPILKQFELEVSRIEGNWNRMTAGQRQIYLERVLKPAYDKSKAELIKDFGEEFVFGSAKPSVPNN